MLQDTLPLLLFLLQSLLFLQASETKILDLQGEVLNVQKFTLANQPAPFVQILLHTSEGDITVEIGPDWYLEAKGINLLPQDHLTIRGLFTEIGNTKIFIAYHLKKDGNAVRLRAKNGTPVWSRKTPNDGQVQTRSKTPQQESHLGAHPVCPSATLSVDYVQENLDA